MATHPEPYTAQRIVTAEQAAHRAAHLRHPFTLHAAAALTGCTEPAPELARMLKREGYVAIRDTDGRCWWSKPPAQHAPLDPAHFASLPQPFHTTAAIEALAVQRPDEPRPSALAVASQLRLAGFIPVRTADNRPAWLNPSSPAQDIDGPDCRNRSGGRLEKDCSGTGPTTDTLLPGSAARDPFQSNSASPRATSIAPLLLGATLAGLLARPLVRILRDGLDNRTVAKGRVAASRAPGGAR